MLRYPIYNVIYIKTLAYLFLAMTMFPYTIISLKRKNCRCLGFFLQSFVRTPSPTSTLDGHVSGLPEDPKHVSTWLIRRVLISVLASLSTIIKSREKSFTQNEKS